MKSKFWQVFKIAIAANVILFIGLLTAYGIIEFKERLKPTWLIRTTDGVYYSNNVKSYGDRVTFSQGNEMVTKSQKGLSGVVIERVK